MPKVCVLLCVYNGEQWLDQCLQSIMQQSFNDFEVFIHDDGSTDSTRARLKKLSDEFPDFKVSYSNVNRGLTASLKLLENNITHDYIARIDVDDFWLPWHLEELVSFLDENAEYCFVGASSIIRKNARVFKTSVVQNPWIIKWLSIYHNAFVHSSVVIRAEKFKRVGGYNIDIRYGQDFELWCRLISVGRAANLDIISVVRNIHSASIGSNKKDQRSREVQNSLLSLRNAGYISTSRWMSAKYYFVLRYFVSSKLKKLLHNVRRMGKNI